MNTTALITLTEDVGGYATRNIDLNIYEMSAIREKKEYREVRCDGEWFTVTETVSEIKDLMIYKYNELNPINTGEFDES